MTPAEIGRAVAIAPSNEAGIALVLALLLAGFFAAAGLGLALTLSTDRLSDRNHLEQARLLYAADAGLALTASALAQVADLDDVLAGQPSAHVDGPPTGARALPGGGVLDFGAATSLLTCGRVTACSDAQRATVTSARPYGSNNPAWQPFVHLPYSAIGGTGADGIYVAVWIGDDGLEADGDPWTDGGGTTGAGRGVLRAHVEAYGRQGARRALEADLVRRCGDAGPAGTCLPGIRVQSWREVSGALP
ncbi:MAG: hypothetical protein AB7O67_00340 [Vicinamibacterales bacterium]